MHSRSPFEFVKIQQLAYNVELKINVMRTDMPVSNILFNTGRLMEFINLKKRQNISKIIIIFVKHVLN
jgi:hypothetical protein